MMMTMISNGWMISGWVCRVSGLSMLSHRRAENVSRCAGYVFCIFSAMCFFDDPKLMTTKQLLLSIVGWIKHRMIRMFQTITP